jgi:Fe2+ or Zn2+ uptake regulation protein
VAAELTYSQKRIILRNVRSSRPEILAAFRHRKVRCTPQRYTILEYLNRNARHPTAEEIYQAINRTDPRASLATVYKSLHAMASAGLIREVTVEGNAVRFESNMGKHHHLFVSGAEEWRTSRGSKSPRFPGRARLGRRTSPLRNGHTRSV